MTSIHKEFNTVWHYYDTVVNRVTGDVYHYFDTFSLPIWPTVDLEDNSGDDDE